MKLVSSFSKVHIHHEENNNHDDQLEHYGSGHHQNYGHGGYHHVKVNLHGTPLEIKKKKNRRWYFHECMLRNTLRNESSMRLDIIYIYIMWSAKETLAKRGKNSIRANYA